MTFRDVFKQFQQLNDKQLDEPFRLHAEGEFFTKATILRLTEGETEEDNWLVLGAE